MFLIFQAYYSTRSMRWANLLCAYVHRNVLNIIYTVSVLGYEIICAFFLSPVFPPVFPKDFYHEIFF